MSSFIITCVSFTTSLSHFHLHGICCSHTCTCGLITCVSHINIISLPRLSLNYQNQTRTFQALGSRSGVRIQRSQGRGRRPRWWGTRPVAAGGEVGCDIGGCLGRRRWSVAASSCGTGTRAAEPGPAMRGPDGGGDGRRSCAAAACSRRVDAPLKGLPWGGGTTTMAVLAGRGSGFATRCSC